MSSKIIILITCSSFWPTLADEYILKPPNHRMNKLVDNPYKFYYVPAFVGKTKNQSRKHHNRNVMTRPLLSRHMEPPDPDAVSSYREFYGKPMAQTDGNEVLPYNHRPTVYTGGNKNKLTKVREERPAFSREHDPFAHTPPETEKSQETKVSAKKKSKKKTSESLLLSPDGDRVEFQMQGHQGPATYIFGFDTGDGGNRQFRLEERSKDGSVKGHYGYYDARGKLRTVRYVARPVEGYTEKHHESNNASSEEQ